MIAIILRPDIVLCIKFILPKASKKTGRMKQPGPTALDMSRYTIFSDMIHTSTFLFWFLICGIE